MLRLYPNLHNLTYDLIPVRVDPAGGFDPNRINSIIHFTPSMSSESLKENKYYTFPFYN